MRKYMKCLISFLLGGGCLFLSTTMAKNKDQEIIVYFLFIIGVVNIYLGVKDLMAIVRNKK